MAKINARGAREQARWRVTLTEGYETPNEVMDYSVEYLYVLNTQGTLLHRTSKIEGRTVNGGYTVRGKLTKTPVDDREAKVEAYLTKRYGAAAWKWEAPR